MSKKFTQKDLDKALDKIKQGPIGKRSEGQWDQYRTLLQNSLDNAKDSTIRKRISKNTDWKAVRAKQVANTDYSIAARGLRAANVARRKPVKAFFKGKYVNTFESVLACSKQLNLLQGGISNILNPKHVAKSYKGYTFEYV